MSIDEQYQTVKHNQHCQVCPDDQLPKIRSLDVLVALVISFLAATILFIMIMSPEVIIGGF